MSADISAGVLSHLLDCSSGLFAVVFIILLFIFNKLPVYLFLYLFTVPRMNRMFFLPSSFVCFVIYLGVCVSSVWCVCVLCVFILFGVCVSRVWCVCVCCVLCVCPVCVVCVSSVWCVCVQCVVCVCL